MSYYFTIFNHQAIFQFTKAFTNGCKQAFQIIKKYHNLKHGDITKSLSRFYTGSSEKRTNTRKRNWPEFEHMLQEVNKLKNGRAKEEKDGHKSSQSKGLMILELGCGDGRFAQVLDQELDVPFSYIGIDCSDGLIENAKNRDYKNNIQFFVGDMIQYLHFLEQQSVDLVVSIASIQHLHYEKRQLLRNEVYRVLNYGGLHITTNRSYSKRMMTKHRSTIIAGLILQVLNHKTFGWNDYMIPFKEAKAKAKAKDVIAANGTLDGHTEELRAMPIKPGTKNQELRTKDQELITSYRFYHIYLLGSLIHYAHTAGFVVDRACYVGQNGDMSDKRYQSRNTFLVGRKDVN